MFNIVTKFSDNVFIIVVVVFVIVVVVVENASLIQKGVKSTLSGPPDKTNLHQQV
jgi:hypothetical protein